jgi:hypothetical protein
MFSVKELDELAWSLARATCVPSLALAKQLLAHRSVAPINSKELYFAHALSTASALLYRCGSEEEFLASFHNFVAERANKSNASLKSVFFYMDDDTITLLQNLALVNEELCSAAAAQTNEVCSAFAALRSWFNKTSIRALAQRRKAPLHACCTWADVVREALGVVEISRAAQRSFPYACVWYTADFERLNEAYWRVRGASERLDAHARPRYYIEKRVYERGRYASEAVLFFTLVERYFHFNVPWPFFVEEPSVHTRYPTFCAADALAWLAESSDIVANALENAWVEVEHRPLRIRRSS